MKWTRGAMAALLAVTVVFALTGCGLIAQKAAESATGVKVDNGGKSVTVTGQDGKTATVQADQNKLPEGLPDNVPAYQGTIKSSTVINSDQGKNFSFMVETADTVQTVFDSYKKQLTDKGWKIEQSASSSSNGQDAGIISASNGTSQMQVTIATSDGKTEVNSVVIVK